MGLSLIKKRFKWPKRQNGFFWGLAVLLGLGACQPAGQIAPVSFSELPSDTLQAPIEAPSFAGQFLAARYAQHHQDNAAASHYFSEAMRTGAIDETLLRYGFINHYQNGNLAEALQLAREFERLDFDFGLAAEPAIAKAVQDTDWQALIALSEKIEISDDFHLLAGGLRSLAYLGLGEPETALGIFHELENFVTLSEQNRHAPLWLLGGAIFEYLGKKDEAVGYYRQALAESQNEYVTLRAGARLWHLGTQADIEKLWQTRLSADSAPLKLIEQINVSADSPPAPPELAEMVARFLFETSWLSEDSYHSNLLIARAHLATSIWPEISTAQLVLAEWYLKAEIYERAEYHLAQIDKDAPVYLRGQLAHLALLEQKGHIEQAILKITPALAKSDRLSAGEKQQRALLAQAGGNILRRADKCDKALVFFQQALDYGMENYRLYRNFGICYEQINNQTEAEKALLKAIELNPNDAIALNYLGYWWADENRHLEKAITFIQKAVQLQPYSGYYADSLGWVYYRQGAFDKAVLWLEKAIQLTPTDAIISEHLGDAYWQTGRFAEARFKWQYALDMGIEESRIEGLKAKLDKGL